MNMFKEILKLVTVTAVLAVMFVLFIGVASNILINAAYTVSGLAT